MFWESHLSGKVVTLFLGKSSNYLGSCWVLCILDLTFPLSEPVFWESLIRIHRSAKVVAIWQLQEYNQLCDLISLTLLQNSTSFLGVKIGVEVMRKTVLSDFLENFTYNYYLESDQNRTGCMVAPHQELVRTRMQSVIYEL